MATEIARGWPSQAAAVPQLRQAWREAVLQQWLIRANARLEIQSVLTSRTRDYLDQLQQHIDSRRADIQKQLNEYGPASGSTQPSGRLNRIVSKIIDDKISNGEPVTARTVTAALTGMGEAVPSTGEVQGMITREMLLRQ